MKNESNILKKAKLFYSGELLVFAVAFLVIAILKFVGVIAYNATRQTVFNWITIFGGSWIIIDFFWAVFSKTRRPKVALIDKIIHLPAGIYLVTYDLYCFIAKPAADTFVCKYGVAIVISYLCLCYTFEAIYHYFYPIPNLITAVEEDENSKVVSEQEAEIVEEEKEQVEENKDE